MYNHYTEKGKAKNRKRKTEFKERLGKFMKFRLLLHFYRNDKFVGQSLIETPYTDNDLDKVAEHIRKDLNPDGKNPSDVRVMQILITNE